MRSASFSAANNVHFFMFSGASETRPLRRNARASKAFDVCNHVIDITVFYYYWHAILIAGVSVLFSLERYRLLEQQVEYCNKLCLIMRQHVQDQ